MLAQQVQQKTIDGMVYNVTPLPAGVSLKVLARVLRMAAPAFGDVATLASAASAVGKMLSGLAGDLDEATVEYVCSELAKVTRVDLGGKKVVELSEVFDEHFRGRVWELFEWLRFAAEVSYGPLFERLKAAADKAESATPSA